MVYDREPIDCRVLILFVNNLTYIELQNVKNESPGYLKISF